MVEVGIGLIPSNITTITQVTVVYCYVYLFLLVVFTKNSMVMTEVIVVVIMEDVDLGLKRPATIPFTIVFKVLMVVL